MKQLQEKEWQPADRTEKANVIIYQLQTGNQKLAAQFIYTIVCTVSFLV
jgi:hypothetical protein